MTHSELGKDEDKKVETWGKVRVHNNEHVEVLQGDSLWRIAKSTIEHHKPGELVKPGHIAETVEEYKKANEGKVKKDGTIYPTAHTGEYLTIPPLFKQTGNGTVSKNGTGESVAIENKNSEAKAEPEADKQIATADSKKQNQENMAEPKLDSAKEPERQNAEPQNRNKESEPSGYLGVSKEIATGALEEVTEHPVKVAAIAAASAVGTAVVAAVVAPEVIVAAAVAGAAYAAYEVYDNIDGWMKSAKTVANDNEHTKEEVEQSRKDLREMGAGMTDLAAGAVGGSAAVALTRATTSSIAGLTGAARSETSALSSNAQQRFIHPTTSLPEEIMALPPRARADAIHKMTEPLKPTNSSSATSGALLDRHVDKSIINLPPSTRSAAIRNMVQEGAGQEAGLLNRKLPQEVMNLPPNQRAEIIRAMIDKPGKPHQP